MTRSILATIKGLFTNADELLRSRTSILTQGGPGRQFGVLFLTIALFGMIYGAVMGSYGGVFGDRFFQVVFSAVKVPILLVVTFAISLPSFFVFNTLFGLRTDVNHAIKVLIASQAGLTIVLSSFAPLTFFWYVSIQSYDAALLFNAFMFGCASLCSQSIMQAYYRPLIRKNHRHRTVLRCWLAIYAFIGIQMAWILRPFVGNPGSPVTFFREDSWGNAYVVLGEIIWRLVEKLF